jgi:hypothetical protein
LEGPQISENGPDSLEPKDEQIPHIWIKIGDSPD